MIPAIDLLGGRCVRLLRGDYAQVTTYGDDPAAVARGFEQAGATWLHVVDLDGAKAGEPTHLAVIARIREATKLRIQTGGGLRSVESIQRTIAAGADRVVLGSALAEDASFAQQVFDGFGDRVIGMVDTRGGLAVTRGWEESTQERGLDVAQRLVSQGCQRIATTDVAHDGTLEGPNLAHFRQFREQLAVPVIASGGVGELADIAALAETGVESVIVGRALYEGKLDLAEAIIRANLS